MTEKKILIRLGPSKGGGYDYINGVWVDTLFDGHKAVAIAYDEDGEVHMVSLRDITVDE